MRLDAKVGLTAVLLVVTAACGQGAVQAGSVAGGGLSISGSISPIDGGAGATVTLSGATSAATTADATGAFAFSGLPDGTYVLTPSQAGYAFTPASQSVALRGANAGGRHFTSSAVANTHRISGTIAPAAQGAGAALTLGGAASATTRADATGAYAFTGLASGTYTVTPSKAGVTFTPSSLNATVTGRDVDGQDFTAAAVVKSHRISGTIGPAAAGVGATVTLGGATSATTTADASGAYAFTGLADGSYTVTPSRAGYAFTPASLAVAVGGADVAGQDFTAAALTYRVSGTISPAAGGAGATVTLGGAASATTTADATGAWYFTGLADGSYTVTPSRAGYTFTPASRATAVSGADVAGQDFTAAAVVNTYRLSGTFSPAAGGAGATLTLGGAASATTTADAAGAYAFAGLASGSYTVTPSRTGYTFTPASRATAVSGADVAGQDFTAAAVVNTYRLSGTISPAAGGAGATVALSGAASTTTTADASGAYAFTGLVNGSYTVTPTRAGYSFTPASRSATVSGGDVTGWNFTAAALVYRVSGTIGPAAGGAGATLTLGRAASATTTADASGVYAFTGLADGSYTVTPSRSGYAFTPATRDVTVSGANAGGQDFTATAVVNTYRLSGTISPAAGGAGATVTLGGAVSATTTADASGAYAFTGLASGSYTVTPSRAGYTFSPASRAAAVSGADVSGQDFTAAAVVNTYRVSGTIGPAAGGAGATVTLGGAASATTTADASGAYAFTGLASGSYTLTPSRTGYSFAPATLTATVSGADLARQDFTASAVVTTHQLSGTISPAAGGAGATVTLGGAASVTTTADGSGAYAFTGLANGTYTVTPAKAGYTYTPAGRTATVNGADVTAQDFAAVANTYRISGTIGPAAGGTGATVALSGAASATTTADASGTYAFTGLADGTYTVTPAKAGYTFTPTGRTATVSGADVTAQDFAAVANTYRISGTISPAAGGAGATVTLGGAGSATTTADASGTYAFTGLVNGTYTVAPAKAGYTFTPAGRTATVNGADVTAQDFAAAAVVATHQLSGTISPMAWGAGVTVTLSGAANATTTTDASGAYAFTGLANGTYTVTPARAGYTFTPASRSATVSGADETGLVFTAAASGTVFFDDFTEAVLGPEWVIMNRAGDYSNSERECYAPSQVALTSGNLVITAIAQATACGDAYHAQSSFPIRSGLVQWSTFNFTYGTVEWAGTIAGGGAWPAIWLLGANCQSTNVVSADNTGSCSWPNAGSDEIDFSEFFSPGRVEQNIWSTGKNFSCNFTLSDASANRHVYQLIWSRSGVSWKVDGATTCSTTNSPNTPMFLIINVASASGTLSPSPQRSTIEYVKVTQP